MRLKAPARRMHVQLLAHTCVHASVRSIAHARTTCHHADSPAPTARASITYKIKAACDQAGLLKADIKSAASIEVLQHAKGPPPQAVVLADEQSLSFLCCFNKGVVGLALQADCDTHLPGGVLRLQAQVGACGARRA